MLIVFYVLVGAILLYSIILHELAHAKVAEMMGDSTARMCGRLTLNPIPHLDLFGTLLPILLIIFRSPIVLGWAKPVPINPYNFHDYKKGMIWVSSAGILANLFVAWILAIVVKFLLPNPTTDAMSVLEQALLFGVRINIVLAVFNLLPIPPLDGSRIFSTLLPSKYSQHISRLEPFGFFILILLLQFPPTQMLLVTVIDFVYNLMMLKF
ncbi:MAG: site-2 protease family protein [Candidatus Saganbacteria bacterium]|nr:site-2 protease family protein [Candidatus Saganbacteria bacterium]